MDAYRALITAVISNAVSDAALVKGPIPTNKLICLNIGNKKTKENSIRNTLRKLHFLVQNQPSFCLQSKEFIYWYCLWGLVFNSLATQRKILCNKARDFLNVEDIDFVKYMNLLGLNEHYFVEKLSHQLKLYDTGKLCRLSHIKSIFHDGHVL